MSPTQYSFPSKAYLARVRLPLAAPTCLGRRSSSRRSKCTRYLLRNNARSASSIPLHPQCTFASSCSCTLLYDPWAHRVSSPVSSLHHSSHLLYMCCWFFELLFFSPSHSTIDSIKSELYSLPPGGEKKRIICYIFLHPLLGATAKALWWSFKHFLRTFWRLCVCLCGCIANLITSFMTGSHKKGIPKEWQKI